VPAGRHRGDRGGNRGQHHDDGAGQGNGDAFHGQDPFPCWKEGRTYYNPPNVHVRIVNDFIQVIDRYSAFAPI
jgi:hypothetical protein